MDWLVDLYYDLYSQVVLYYDLCLSMLWWVDLSYDFNNKIMVD